MQYPGEESSDLRPRARSELNGPSAIDAAVTRVMSSSFQLDRRFEFRDVLGTGAYGIVVSATDSVTGEEVAIKKIEKAFEHSTFTKRALRELKIMRLLDHENVLNVKSIQLPKSREEFDEIYVVSDLMETDLTSIIRSPQALSDEHCQFFLYQILRGLKYMFSANILHRDLKPRNLLVNSNCDLKICDFGLARFFSNEMTVTATQMSEYVATRWYRPPELLLSFKKYNTAMDIWSAGTIFGELLTRRPILPGSDANHQLDLIFNLNGTPTEEDIQAIPHPKAKERVLKVPKKNPKPYEMVFRDANPLALDLLKRMLTFNPEKRISVEDALAHPYLSALHCEEDEPVAEPTSMFDFEFERQILTMRELKDMIYEEILLYHFTDKKEEYRQRKTEYERQVRYIDEEAKNVF